MSLPLLVVVDTNVLVSAALTPGGMPWQVIQSIADGLCLPLFDPRMLAEYQDVLRRPRLKLSDEVAVGILRAVTATGRLVVTDPLPYELPDPKDVPFLEVALSGRADSLVTGNTRDFDGAPVGLVVSPRDFLARLRGEGH